MARRASPPLLFALLFVLLAFQLAKNDGNCVYRGRQIREIIGELI